MLAETTEALLLPVPDASGQNSVAAPILSPQIVLLDSCAFEYCLHNACSEHLSTVKGDDRHSSLFALHYDVASFLPQAPEPARH